MIATSFLLLGLGLLVPAQSSATVEIQAHRGGANIDGKAAFPENSMAGFSHSLAEGYTIELDLQPTSDGHAVVMHDETLDRTTDCAGPVDDKTLAQLASCRIDLLGADDAAVPLPPGDKRLEPVPTLADVIDILKETGGKASIEVKDLAGEHPSFCPDTYRKLNESGIPSSRITVQNFKPDSLTDAPALYPGVTTSYLTLTFLNGSAVAVAAERGYTQVSPQWPVSAQFVADAKAKNLRIAPYTIDDADGIVAADALGVDAVITNDPTLADRLVGPDPDLSLKIEKRAGAAKPGKVLRLAAKIRNSGAGQSDAGKIGIKFIRTSLKPAGPVSQVVPVVKPDSEHTIVFRVRVRNGAKKFGKFPVNFKLTVPGTPTLKKAVKVKVLRPGKG